MIAGDVLLAGVLRASKDAILAFEVERDAAGRIADFRCILANEAAERLMPRKGGTWVGSSLKQDPGLFQGGEVWQAFSELVNRGTMLDRDLSFKRADGWQRLRLTGDKIGDGFVAILAEAAGVREARAASDRVLQAVFDAIPHPTFVKDLDSRYVRVNRAMTDLWQVSPEAVIGRQMIAQGARPDTEARRTVVSDQEVLETGLTIDQVRPQTLPDGSERMMRIKKAPIANERGEVLGLVGMAEDITDRVKAEEALRRAEALLSTVINTLPHQIVAKNKEGTYILVNQSWLGHFALTAEQVIGKQALAVEGIAEPYRSTIDGHDRYVLQSGQPLVNMDVMRVSAAGEERAFKLTKLPLFDTRRHIDGLVSIAEDITAEKQTLAALRESEQRFRNLVEGSLQGVAIMQGRRIVFGNPAYLQMFGWESMEDAYKAGSVLDVVAPQERERVRGIIAAREAGKPAPESYEVELIRKDGARFWAYVLARPVTWDGKLATQVVFFDSTVRRRAEQELRANQRLLRTVLDTLPHSVFVKDLEGRFLFVNAQKAEYHGMRPEDLTGKTAEEVPWPDGPAAEATLRAEREVLATGKPSGIGEIETFDMAGRSSIRKLIQLPLLDDGGKLEGTVGISLDMTAEVTARREAEVAHTQLADALESFPGVIVLYDRDNRVVLWNSKADEHWGRTNTPLEVGMPYEQVVRAAVEHLEGISGAAMDERVASLVESFTQTSRHREFKHSDGRWFRSMANKMSFGGTVVAMIETSESHRLDEELRQAQKMEAVGQLTGGIAHDFNNLLTVILGNSDFILETVHEAQAQACARMITQAAQQGSALTQRLLSFARRQSLQPVELDLNKAVSSMGELVRRTLGEHIEIELIRGGGLWRALTDPSQLEAALLNLAVNARDAMPDGGKLTVETANAWLDDSYAAAHAEVLPGQYVLLSVTDTGHGMPREVVERAFDPFFTTKQQGKGTGLGLSMVYGFVKQSGGHVKIYSEPGQGTSVKLYLPRYLGPSQADAEPLADPANDPMPLGAETILVVEDDDLVRVNTVQQLVSLGYDVIAVEDARRALEALERLPRVHLLFTDVVMPGGMNGRQLADEAQRVWPGLKVLFASGYTPNAIVHHGRLDPGIQLISKPYRKTDLARKVRRVLDA